MTLRGLIFVLLATSVASFGTTPTRQGNVEVSLAATTAATGQQDRRGLLQTVMMGVTSGLFLSSSPANAVLGSGRCASGEGEGCTDLAEGNDYIRSLQIKSAANKDMYAQEALNAYNMKNYPDFFASLNPPKYLVKGLDGKFLVYTDAELSVLKDAGKIKLEIAKAMGGKVTDLTQKPMMVLVE